MKNALAIIVTAIILAMPVMGFCAILIAPVVGKAGLAFAGFLSISIFGLTCLLYITNTDQT